MINATLTKIEQGITEKVTPENREAFQKAIIAGGKIMFDPKTHAHMEIVKNPAARKEPVKTVALGVSGLMWVMFMQSKRTMPIEVLIMAGTVLMTKAIDFVERGIGIPFDNDMIAQCTKILAESLFNKLGITPEQLNEAIQAGKQEMSNDWRSKNGGAMRFHHVAQTELTPERFQAFQALPGHFQ